MGISMPGLHDGHSALPRATVRVSRPQPVLSEAREATQPSAADRTISEGARRALNVFLALLGLVLALPLLLLVAVLIKLTSRVYQPPRRNRITGTVWNMIRRSSRRLCFSMYSRS